MVTLSFRSGHDGVVNRAFGDVGGVVSGVVSQFGLLLVLVALVFVNSVSNVFGAVSAVLVLC